MLEVYYEETAQCAKVSSEKRKYYVLNTFKILSIVLIFLWVFLIFTTMNISDITKGSLILNIIYILFPILFFVGFAILFGKMKNKCCLDYDYVFISGSIRISKVIKNVKRKNLYKFETTNVEKIGRYGSDSFNLYEKQPNVKTVILTANSTPAEGKNFCYMAVNGIDQNKLVLVLECTDTFLKNVLKFTNSFVLEKDFK